MPAGDWIFAPMASYTSFALSSIAEGLFFDDLPAPNILAITWVLARVFPVPSYHGIKVIYSMLGFIATLE